MKAGIDFGTSLVKAYWLDQAGREHFASTADLSRGDLADRLKHDGIGSLRTVGIGSRRGFEDFAIGPPQADPIGREIRLQADGARRLLTKEGPLAHPFWLVSIGTGTSYAMVDAVSAQHYPLGNPIGGGFLTGLGALLGAHSLGELQMLASAGASKDIVFRDLLPALTDDPRGAFIVSSFAKADARTSREDACATLVRTAAALIVRDLMMINGAAHCAHYNDVVFIGTPVSRLPILAQTLAAFCMALGIQPLMPANGAYAAALGAYHSEA